MDMTSADLRDEYCVSGTSLGLTIKWLVTSDIHLNSSRQTTPDLVFVVILKAIPSGLLFLFVFLQTGLGDVSIPYLLLCSRVFVLYIDRKPLEIPEPVLSTLYGSIFHYLYIRSVT